MLRIIKNVFLFVLLIGSTLYANGTIKVKVELSLSSNNEETILIQKQNLCLYKKAQFDNLDEIEIYAVNDQKKIQEFFFNAGYLNAKVKYSIITHTQKNITVSFLVTEGYRYKIANIILNNIPNELEIKHEYIGKFFDIHYITALESLVLQRLKTSGYPLACSTDRQVIVNDKRHDACIIIDFKVGHSRIFGNVTIVGLTKIKESYIRKKILWTKGDKFDSRILEEVRKSLASSRLFSNVEIKLVANPDDKHIDIILNLKEGKHHTIEIGLKYANAYNAYYRNAGIIELRGLFMRGTWTHFNLFGEGETLKLIAETMPFYSKRKTINDVVRNISPSFLYQIIYSQKSFIKDYETSYATSYNSSWSNKFVRKAKNISVTFKPCTHSTCNKTVSFNCERYSLRTFRDKLTEETTFSCISASAKFDFDYRNDVLDATKGSRFIVTLTPQFCLNIKRPIFLIVLENYLFFELPKDLTLVPWLKIKSLALNAAASTPADKLLYAGGARSARGYALDMAGELNGNIPIGGKSTLDFGAEIRKKFSKTWGGSIFFESAMVSSCISPHNGKIFHSFGIGAIYYTPIGPIKIDIAFPLKKRKGIDNFMQLYISLGQQF